MNLLSVQKLGRAVRILGQIAQRSSFTSAEIPRIAWMLFGQLNASFIALVSNALGLKAKS